MAKKAATGVETRLQAFDVVTQWTLQQLTLWSGWVGAAIKDNERAATLKLLVRLVLFSKRTGDCVLNTAEFASLRLAATDVATALAQPEEKAIIRSFEENLALLQRSWVL